MNSKEFILVLPSWYPSRVEPFNGDFIQRHVEAASIYSNQYIIYVVKDTQAKSQHEEEVIFHENMTECIIYYKPLLTGVKIIDQWISHRTYLGVLKKAIRKFISEKGLPSNVHVHEGMKAGLVALWVKRKWKIPYFVTEHWTGFYPESKPSINDFNFFYRSTLKQILKHAQLVLPVTKALGEKIVNKFIPIHSRVIPNVVNTKLFFYKPSIFKKFRFIHASTLGYQKNPEGMFEAIKIVKERGYDFEVLFLGNSDASLIQIAKGKGLFPATISFRDAVPYAEVANQMQHSSALLMFSRFENLPCVILEALCCGLPVISSRVGGIDEVIDIDNGVLVESENIEQLALSMQTVMDNYESYNREKISLQAIKQYNYNTIGKLITECYKPLGKDLIINKS